jgi:hypothetical protein
MKGKEWGRSLGFARVGNEPDGLLGVGVGGPGGGGGGGHGQAIFTGGRHELQDLERLRVRDIDSSFIEYYNKYRVSILNANSLRVTWLASIIKM